MKEKRHFVKKFIIFALKIAVAVGILLLGLNLYVVISTGRDVAKKDTPSQKNADFIVILGCGIWHNGTEPSPMLQDRLDCAIKLYKSGVAPKLLMTGDNENADYNEVGVMKRYAIEKGVPSEDIYVDPYGLSTYDSMKRAKDVFGIEDAVIVTQEYHAYRAVYVAKSFGIKAFAVSCDARSYSGQILRDIRELAARAKDLCFCIAGPEAKYTSPKADMTKNGDETDLKQTV